MLQLQLYHSNWSSIYTFLPHHIHFHNLNAAGTHLNRHKKQRSFYPQFSYKSYTLMIFFSPWSFPQSAQKIYEWLFILVVRHSVIHSIRKALYIICMKLFQCFTLTRNGIAHCLSEVLSFTHFPDPVNLLSNSQMEFRIELNCEYVLDRIHLYTKRMTSGEQSKWTSSCLVALVSSSLIIIIIICNTRQPRTIQKPCFPPRHPTSNRRNNTGQINNELRINSFYSMNEKTLTTQHSTEINIHFKGIT